MRKTYPKHAKSFDSDGKDERWRKASKLSRNLARAAR